MARIHLLALLIGAFITLAAAASAPTFCKCTCFKNSTIIPLGPEHAAADATASSEPESSGLSRSLRLAMERTPQLSAPEARQEDARLRRRAASASCSSCTKAFCLGQDIDICADATEDDVVTLCFQRDSNKDKIIVWGFIVGTLGLLAWAAFKRVVQWRGDRSLPMGRQGVNYAPVLGSNR